MIGIVGGVGPLAGLDIVKKIIEETIASTDQEHLPVLLSSQPNKISDRTAYLLGKTAENPAYAIVQIILELEKTGATVAAIPCHTAHASRIFDVVKEELIEAKSRIRLLHMVEETAAYIQLHYGKIDVGVLATTGTKNTGLYPGVLAHYDLKAIEPDEQLQESVHAAIYDKTYGIKAVSSPVSNRARQELITSIAELKKAGAQAIILGGAEFPLAISEKESAGLPIIDPNRILARALVREIDIQKLREL
ncbi:aspartate/glutamate racemase family protein [Sphingobacterium sp. LRF_L2]|uniref:aspartate/glutamate racemase family protein n=1 Tax=Sphingobacterium sp. LRF_L2 TaxID=3369421 RepID=UPI003F61B3A0